MGLSYAQNALATDAVVIWEPKADTDKLIAAMGIGATAVTSLKADGSVLVKGLSACRFAATRGVNNATQGEEAFLVT